MMTIGLIALDLDGTLLDSQKNLSERNRRALERCARMGIQIVGTSVKSRCTDNMISRFHDIHNRIEISCLSG